MKIVFYHMKGTTLIHFYFQKTTLIFSKTTYIQNENCVLSYEGANIDTLIFSKNNIDIFKNNIYTK